MDCGNLGQLGTIRFGIQVGRDTLDEEDSHTHTIESAVAKEDEREREGKEE